MGSMSKPLAGKLSSSLSRPLDGMGGVVRNTDPLSSIESSAEFDLDVTISDSFDPDVNNQLWKNLIVSPPSGASQTDYDQYLGGTASPSTDDPTFNGTAGSPSATWGFDGGDDFLTANGNNTFLNNLHKTDSNKQDFTIIYTGVNASSSLANIQMMGTGWAGSSGRQGWGLTFTGSVDRVQLTHYGDTGSGGSAEYLRIGPTGAMTPGENFIIGAAFTHSTNTAKVWINSGTPTTKVLSITASTSNAFFTFGAFLGEFVLSCGNGVKGRSCSGFNKALNNTEFTNIAERLGHRHEVTYV